MSRLKLINYHSKTLGATPPPADLAEGEIAVNYNANNPFLAIKDSNGKIRKISPAVGMTGSFQGYRFCKFIEIPISNYMSSVGLYGIEVSGGIAGIVSLYVKASPQYTIKVKISYFGAVYSKNVFRIKKNNSTISIFALDSYNVSYSFFDLCGNYGRFSTPILAELKTYSEEELSQFGDDYGDIYYNVADNLSHSFTVAGKTFNGVSDVNVDSIDCGEF